MARTRPRWTRRKKLALELCLLLPVICLWLVIFDFPHVTAQGAFRDQERQAMLSAGTVTAEATVECDPFSQGAEGLRLAGPGQRETRVIRSQGADGTVRIGVVQQSLLFWDAWGVWEMAGGLTVIAPAYPQRGESDEEDVEVWEGFYVLYVDDPAVTRVVLTTRLVETWADEQGRTTEKRERSDSFSAVPAEGMDGLWLCRVRLTVPDAEGRSGYSWTSWRAYAYGEDGELCYTG